jgi:hypothetical protein
MPKVSIAIPTHNMKNGDFFLKRCLDSIREQSFQDYEIVVTNRGKMAENTNRAIKQSTGDLIKVLYMDDYFAHKDALKHIVENFKGDWLITGADTNPHPYWTDDIEEGNNKLGSPSALTIRKGLHVLFDERMSWLLDCDLYRRLYDKYGEPVILDEVNVNIGIHDGQMTNILTDEEKLAEHELMKEKYETY